jgi:hypothetical protein
MKNKLLIPAIVLVCIALGYYYYTSGTFKTIEIISTTDLTNGITLPEEFKPTEAKDITINYNDRIFTVRTLKLTENKINEFVTAILLPQLKISNKASITLNGYTGYKGYITNINSTQQGEPSIILWKDNSLIWITNTNLNEIEYIAKWFIQNYG